MDKLLEGLSTPRELEERLPKKEFDDGVVEVIATGSLFIRLPRNSSLPGKNSSTVQGALEKLGPFTLIREAASEALGVDPTAWADEEE